MGKKYDRLRPRRKGGFKRPKSWRRKRRDMVREVFEQRQRGDKVMRRI